MILFVFRVTEVLLWHLRRRQLHMRNWWLLFRQYELGKWCHHVCSEVIYLHVDFTDEYMRFKIEIPFYTLIHFSVVGRFAINYMDNIRLKLANFCPPFKLCLFFSISFFISNLLIFNALYCLRYMSDCWTICKTIYID